MRCGEEPVNTQHRYLPRMLAALNVLALTLALLAAVVLHSPLGPEPPRPAPVQAVAPPPPVPPGALRRVVGLTHDGLARSYTLYVPARVSQSPAQPAPLLLMLHGRRQSPLTAERYSEFSGLAERAGVIVAYPEGFGGSWNAGSCCEPAAPRGVDDVGFLTAVMGDIASRHRVDPARRYLAGFSNGAMMSYRYACERAAKVTAIVAVGGALAASTPCTPARPVALLHLHGGRDTTIPFEGTTPTDPDPRRSVRDSTAELARGNGCTEAITSLTLAPGLQRSSYVGCPPGGEVSFYRAALLGHSWTRDRSRGLDDTALAWEFIVSRRR